MRDFDSSVIYLLPVVHSDENRARVYEPDQLTLVLWITQFINRIRPRGVEPRALLVIPIRRLCMPFSSIY